MPEPLSRWDRYLNGLKRRSIFYWRILPFILLFLFVLHGYTLEQRLSSCYNKPTLVGEP